MRSVHIGGIQNDGHLSPCRPNVCRLSRPSEGGWRGEEGLVLTVCVCTEVYSHEVVDSEQSVLTDKILKFAHMGTKVHKRPEQLRMSTMIAYLEATGLSSDGLRLSTDLYRSYVNKWLRQGMIKVDETGQYFLVPVYQHIHWRGCVSSHRAS